MLGPACMFEGRWCPVCKADGMILNSSVDWQDFTHRLIVLIFSILFMSSSDVLLLCKHQ